MLRKLASLAKTSARLKHAMGLPPVASPAKATLGPTAGTNIKPSMPTMPKTPMTAAPIGSSMKPNGA